MSFLPPDAASPGMPAPDASAPGGPDRFTETTSRNVLQRLGGALVGAAIGLVLFLVAVGVLVWNESRAVDATRGLAEAGRLAEEASPNAIRDAQDGRLVHLTGALVVRDALADPATGERRADLVRLRRKVEMYQWEEHRDTQSTSQLGGTKTTQTTYTYTRRWSEEPIDSAGFRGNHANPEMPLRTEAFTAADARLGERHVAPSVLEGLDAFAPLPPPADGADGYRREGDALYRGRDAAAPAIGDVRVTFAGVPAQTVSVLAGQRGAELSPFRTASGYHVGLIAPGAVDADDMVAHQRSDEKILTWVLRLVGFLCFLGALLLLAAPVTVLADVIPILGSVVGGGVFFFAIAFALPLTLVTIAFAWLLVRPLLGLGLLVAAVAAFAGLHRLRPRRAAAPA